MFASSIHFNSPYIPIAPDEDPILFYLVNVFFVDAELVSRSEESFSIRHSVTPRARFPSCPDGYRTPFSTFRRGTFTIDDGLSP
jgi:hypothetical protein